MKTIQINKIFDGNSYTIYNLKIDSSEDNVGLFAKTETGAKIRNVGLLNVDIQGGKYVGGLVGNNQGDVSNSYVVGKVLGEDYIGGLVGYNEAKIDNSHVIAKQISGNSKTGGLIGTSNEGNITDSYATVKQLTGCRLVGNSDNDNNTSNKMIGNCNHSTLFE